MTVKTVTTGRLGLGALFSVPSFLESSPLDGSNVQKPLLTRASRRCVPNSTSRKDKREDMRTSQLWREDTRRRPPTTTGGIEADGETEAAAAEEEDDDDEEEDRKAAER